MPEPDDRDTGELNVHRIRALEKRMTETLSREVFDTRMESLQGLLTDVRTELRSIGGKVEDLSGQRLPQRIQRMEETIAWVVRIVVGAVLAAVLGLVIYGGGGIL